MLHSATSYIPFLSLSIHQRFRRPGEKSISINHLKDRFKQKIIQSGVGIGWRTWDVQSACRNRLAGGSKDDFSIRVQCSVYNLLVYEWKGMLNNFLAAKVVWFQRSANTVAHRLTKEDISERLFFYLDPGSPGFYSIVC